MVQFSGVNVEEAIQNGLNELDIPRMKAHITVVSREKKGFLGLFGKKPAVVDIEPIAETTVTKANQQAVKGVPEEINAQNEPVKSVSEETVDLGRVVAAIKKVEEKGQEVSKEVKEEILKHEKAPTTILEEKGHGAILDSTPEAPAQTEASGFSDLGKRVMTSNKSLPRSVAMFKRSSMKWMLKQVFLVATIAAPSICKLILMNPVV